MDEQCNGSSTTVLASYKSRWQFIRSELPVLLCIIIGCIFCIFCYDIPGALQNALTKNFDLTATQFSLLYYLYSAPCVVMATLGGYLVDRGVGLQMTTIIFSALSVVGNALFAIGGCINAFWLMGLGRLLYGTGQDISFEVCLSCYVFSWYKGSYVNLVFSMCDNFGYLGTILVYQLSDRIYEFFKTTFDDRQALGNVLLINCSTILVPFLLFTTLTYVKRDSSEKEPCGTPGNQPVMDHKVRLRDILKFPPSYWCLCAVYSTISNGIFIFGQFSQDMFTSEFNVTVNEASNCLTTMNLTKMAFSIPMSLLVDFFGRNSLFLAASLLVAIASHTLLLLKINPYVCMVALGASYSITASCIWPMFLYPLQKHHYGLGYGVFMSTLNVTSIIFSISAGVIIDNHGYFGAHLFYVIVLIIGFLCSLLSWTLDTSCHGVLNMTPGQRKDYEMKMFQSSEQLTEMRNGRF